MLRLSSWPGVPQSALLLSTLLLSGLVLDEFKSIPSGHVFLFWTSAAVIVGGILLNAWALSRATKAGKRPDDYVEQSKKEKPPWEDELPGATDPEAAAEARKAAAAKFS